MISRLLRALRRAAHFWVDITSDREPPLVLGVFRIVLGVVLLGSLLSAYGSGVLESMWVDVRDGGALHLGEGSFWVALLGGPTRQVTFTLFGFALAAGTLVTLGLAGRLPYLIAGQAYDSLVRINPDTTGAYDSMITNALFLLLFSGANATLSLDCRRKSGSWTSEAAIPAWPRYLLIFQLLVIYGATGLQKVSHTWTPFGGYSALYWVFQDPTWRRFDLGFSAFVYPLLVAGTAASWHFEIAAPGLLLYYYARRTPAPGGRVMGVLRRWDLRKPFAAIGIGLHVGVLIFLNVGPFSFISLAYYLALLRPHEMHGVIARARRRQASGGAGVGRADGELGRRSQTEAT